MGENTLCLVKSLIANITSNYFKSHLVPFGCHNGDVAVHWVLIFAIFKKKKKITQCILSGALHFSWHVTFFFLSFFFIRNQFDCYLSLVGQQVDLLFMPERKKVHVVVWSISKQCFFKRPEF